MNDSPTAPPPPPEPATPDRLFARLDSLGIAVVTHRHAPVRTVEENRRLRGDLPGGHCKNLFLRDKKGQSWLVVTEESRAVDLKALRRRIGAAHLSFGSAERLMAALGVPPGTVSPFALINDPEGRVTVILDAALMDAEVLNFHPLDNAMTTAIAPRDLLAFIRACGHAPRLVDFP